MPFCHDHNLDYANYCEPCSFEEFAQLFLEDNENNQAVLKEEFRITDEASADWVLRKLANWNAEKDRIKANAAARITKLEGMIAYFERRFGPELEAFALKELSKQRKPGKSLKLFNGVLSFKKQPLKLEIFDKDRVLAWAKKHLPIAVKVEETVAKDPINEHFKATGEKPEGVEVIPEHDKFYIKAKE